MAISSLFTYLMTFLSSVALMTMLVALIGYFQGGNTEFLSDYTIALLNDYFPYILIISFLVVVGEWTYKRPKKRKYKGDKYFSDEEVPPF
ncbi:MAG: hypothetical protein ABIG39_07295 [Candidatus Micrarchaeota archaeon]